MSEPDREGSRSTRKRIRRCPGWEGSIGCTRPSAAAGQTPQPPWRCLSRPRTQMTLGTRKETRPGSNDTDALCPPRPTWRCLLLPRFSGQPEIPHLLAGERGRPALMAGGFTGPFPAADPPGQLERTRAPGPELPACPHTPLLGNPRSAGPAPRWALRGGTGREPCLSSSSPCGGSALERPVRAGALKPVCQ